MNEQPTAASQKANALIALLDLGGASRELEPVLRRMRERGIASDIHNLAHLMWPLSKEGKVTFLERKGGGGRGGSVLVNIALTDKGRDTAMALLGMHAVPSAAMRGRGRAAHAIGQDGTDYRRHADVAVGGPIEVVKKENPMDHIPFVVLSDEEAAKYRQIPSRHETLVESSTAEAEPVAPMTPEVAPMSANGQTDTPTQYRESDTPREYPGPGDKAKVNWGRFPDHFPEIAAILAKADKVARFTKAAELLGDEEAELAIAILEKVKISPLEAEIIRLIG